eukprot:GEZU01026152.1.p1 GENE.GEZU01026152.1~~GEZU01026152.1.p1  ORF type:complete len:434 (+),score=149.76 GEZU01026152.1:795-2096(+)
MIFILCAMNTAVELLQRECGIKKTLRVVPLFETLDDLQRCGTVLRKLLSVPWYLEHIHGEQEIMIGYSDSGKDAGRLTAAWNLYKAQEEAVAVCKEFGVNLNLFHGRGGTVGRGGGPAYLAIMSQPPGSVNGRLRVTEQGEMIHVQFGLAGIALQTMEIYTAATLSATFLPPVRPSERWRQIMEELSAVACESYRELVRNKDFVRFFRYATPEPELSYLNIGSRPTRRRKQGNGDSDGGIETLRAIPWNFSFTQMRLMLPAWYGVSAAIKHAIEKRGWLEELREMYRQWDFFRSTLDLIEMVLLKGDPIIALRYNELLVPKEYQPLGVRLADEFLATSQLLLEISGERVLEEHNPELRESILIRKSYVDPINLLQAETMKRLRETDAKIKECTKEKGATDQEALEQLQKQQRFLVNTLLITMNGVAFGMRNTG